MTPLKDAAIIALATIAAYSITDHAWILPIGGLLTVSALGRAYLRRRA